jgi:hypothetical protein
MKSALRGRRCHNKSKLWLPAPDPKISKEILKLNKSDFGLITRWLTGHCFLARHEALLHNEDTTCHLCFIDEQTPWHLLKECPATISVKRNIPPDPWTPDIILKSIKLIQYLEVFPDQILPLLDRKKSLNQSSRENSHQENLTL